MPTSAEQFYHDWLTGEWLPNRPACTPEKIRMVAFAEAFAEVKVREATRELEKEVRKFMDIANRQPSSVSSLGWVSIGGMETGNLCEFLHLRRLGYDFSSSVVAGYAFSDIPRSRNCL